MKITRVYGDEWGETRLAVVEVPSGFKSAIPAVAIRVGLTRQADLEFHPAPVRGFVVAIRGEFEIVTTVGDRKHFQQGEWLFADDAQAKGHSFEAFGAEQELLHCAIPDDWNDWMAVSAAE